MKIKRSNNRLFIEKDETIDCIKIDEIISFGKSIMYTSEIDPTYTVYIETFYGKRQLFFKDEKDRDVVYGYIYDEVVGYELVEQLYDSEV